MRHVLSVTQGGDWPVQRDALDAVLRRCASAHADEIQIVATATGPAAGSVRDPAPWVARTPVPHAAPPDRAARRQLRVRRFPPELARLVQAPRRRPRARGLEAASRRCRARVGSEPAPLRWDPVRPLTGPGDWLARVRWVDGTPDRDLRRWLRPADGHGWTVTVPGASPQRLALVDRLLAALRDGDGEPALHALLQEERARLARQIQTREHAEAAAPCAADPQAIALSLSTRGRRAVLRAGAPAPGRRHGPRQDRAGDRRLPRPLAHRPRPPRPAHRPRRAQAAVASRVAALHRRARRRRRRARPPSAAPRSRRAGADSSW